MERHGPHLKKLLVELASLLAIAVHETNELGIGRQRRAAATLETRAAALEVHNAAIESAARMAHRAGDDALVERIRLLKKSP